ncbi:phosphate ABC transporter substrate-binding protein PstS [Halochromatium salexigens]|uniref:Phosphate-binding protein PstS n=1 Tax=Halochromatium salexigens TaxID=49447 RepID=A0AAJ0XGG2_HALSE|nr:phosphate ABC transporter substrate-binding protein PstS [Halochromatium salexigens]MBK5932069.1 phosphate ABC transporter substrate-binding protein PstS [Halochromatium salexigens]
MRLFAPFAKIRLVSVLCLSILGGCQAEQADRVGEPKQPARDDAITAAGSSFAAPLFNKWLEVYGAEHADLRLHYDSVGSGAGIERFLAGSVDIGATDAPLRPHERDQVEGAFAQLPITGGMIAIAYNLPDFAGPLNLPRDVYTEIFLGNAFRWDDPRIAAANPGLKLPPQLIQVVGRRDSSGTTFAFTNHLAAISDDWAQGPGVGKRIDWPGGAMEAKGNEGVAQRIKITEGSIGYVEAGFAERLGLSIAWLENEAGGFVLPNVETGRRGLANGSDRPPSDLTQTIPDPQGARSYPIVTYTWALVRAADSHPAKTSRVHDLVRWMLTDGQQYAEALRYVPLPKNLTQAALAELDRL